MSAKRMIRQALCRVKAASPFVRTFSAAIELREYNLKPSRAGEFQKLANASGALRKELAPLRLFATSDTGGQLHRVFHFYYHPSLQSRDDVARGMRECAQWTAFEGDAARCCDKQSSSIYAEAPFVAECYGGMSTERIATADRCAAVYELRRYRLVLGYDTVPRFMDYYSSGLSSKLQVSVEAGSRFCSLLYTEVGSLNEVVELWRHHGVAGMVQARVLSRQSQPWKKAVANIAPLALSFSNTLLTPAPFSNWC
jgi:hypothetical protein